MRFGLREVIFLMVLLGMPVAAYWFVFKPHNTQINAARAEIKAKQAKLKQLELAAGRINNLGQEIDKLTSAIELFEAKLPAQKEVDVILKQVWQLASKNGLIPRKVKADKPIKSSRYTEQPLKIEIVGDFNGFYSFLLDMEKLSRLTRIPEMKLKKEQSTEGYMTASFTLSIFFEPQAGPSKLQSI